MQRVMCVFLQGAWYGETQASMKSEALCEICKKNSKSNSNRTAVQRLRNQDQMGGKEINMESSHILCLFGFHVTCGIGKSHILRLARGLYIYIYIYHTRLPKMGDTSQAAL